MDTENESNKFSNEPGRAAFFKDIVRFTLLALIIVLPIRLFIAQPFVVSGASMDDTFKNGEYLIVDEISYRFRNPDRGEVIIFKYPFEQRRFLIKRVIGVPGDTVTIRGGSVSIINQEFPQGYTLEEPYVSSENKMPYTELKTVLEDGEYFVMGDNRSESSDSRLWGALDQRLIVGRPLVRLFPLNRISVLPR